MKVKTIRGNFVRCFPLFSFLVLVLSTTPVYAMHIMEGFLPVGWCIAWAILCLPVLFIGIKHIKDFQTDSKMTMLLALAGGFIFVLSALKIPSVTGSCSHPTGTGLAAILFGPAVTSVLGLIVLVFQALLLAHGGLTTLGANVFSMAIVGPLAAYGIYKAVRGKADYEHNKKRVLLAVFLAATLGDLITYVVTSFQLAFAHPGASFFGSLGKFLSVFAVTQIPLAIVEGIITTILFSFIAEHNKEELSQLKVFA